MNSLRLLLVVLVLSTGMVLAGDDPTPPNLVCAGDDQNICRGTAVDLTDMGAYIDPSISYAKWNSLGDGTFVPNDSFGVATHYYPSSAESNENMFILSVESFNPVSIDYVNIFNTDAPLLLCNDHLNIPLDFDCELEITPQFLLLNPQGALDKYIITLIDEHGHVIPNNTITSDQVNTSVTYTVGHDCSTSTCSGSFNVYDNIAPVLNCMDRTIDCLEETIPDSLGFPVDTSVVKISVLDSVYYGAVGLDGCGLTKLRYFDEETVFSCKEDRIIKKIDRTWTAEDAFGNSSSCTEHITVMAMGLDSIVFPPNFDNINNLSFECYQDFKKLENGNPSPDTTGYPIVRSCSNINISYKDTRFDICGGGYKVLRKWEGIDWCTSKDTIVNQIIKVEDKLPPIWDNRPASFTYPADPYACKIADKEIKVLGFVEDCSEWSHFVTLKDTTGNDLSNQYVNGTHIINVPIGQYELGIRLKDECGNDSLYNFPLHVRDEIAPNAVCKTYTKASITEEGTVRVYAVSLDNESYDNCGIDSMLVARMDPVCDSIYGFRPYVDFCCEDVGKSHMVTFRVIDASGNYNECMVEVFVEDKLPPILQCPSDFTISCSFDAIEENYNNFGQVRSSKDSIQAIIIDGEYKGNDGYYLDNCGATLIIEDSTNVHCGNGHIYRKFTVTDIFGNSTYCTQTITVENDDPFVYEDIDWPDNREVSGCDSLDASPDITGRPILNTLNCSMAEATYTDKVFTIVEDACVKILRKWSVIDWCGFDQETGEGLWEYTQIIKLNNTIAPVFAPVQDTLFCQEVVNCDLSQVILSAEATDDCTPTSQLVYSWSIDYDDDGSFDDVGVGNTFDELIPFGTHSLRWKTADKCGNIAFAYQKVTTKQCKKPTPYCIGDISTAVMPSSKALEIEAASFNLNSSDNCTPPEDLIFSFSMDTSETTRVLTCADIPDGISADVELEMWVTDHHGNQNFCDVTINVADNDDVCDDASTVIVFGGTIQTRMGTPINGATMSLSTTLPEGNQSTTSASDGTYAFAPTDDEYQYSIMPDFTTENDLGVNTRDLILIQNHLLKKDTLATALDTIAADVNNDGRVNPFDLFLIRKAILFDDFKFTAGQGGWMFYDAAFDYTTLNKVLEAPEGIEYVKGNTREHYDLYAVKVGDVNSSVDKKLKKTGARNVEQYPIHIREENGRRYISLDPSLVLDGLQFEVNVEDATIYSDVLSDDEYTYDGKVLRVVYTSTSGHLSEPILWVEGGGAITLSSGSFDSEAYAGDEVFDIRIEDTSDAQESVLIYPNPFKDHIALSHTKISQLSDVSITDALGKQIVAKRDVKLPFMIDTRSWQAGTYIVSYTYIDGSRYIEKMVKY